jgi:hypothetical protein
MLKPLSLLFTLTAVLFVASPSHAACDPTTDPDASDLAAARAAVEANCPCFALGSRAD